MTAPLSYGSSSIVDRMRRAAMLDASLYEEVEHDTSATGQAAVVVAIVAVASAIGSWRVGIIAGPVWALLSWAAWAGIAYLVGTRVFDGRATWGEVLRTTGFAQAPGVLLVLGIIPVLGGLTRFVVGIWMLVTGWVALRAALDLDNMKTLLTVVLGWLATMALGWVLALASLRLF